MTILWKSAETVSADFQKIVIDYIKQRSSRRRGTNGCGWARLEGDPLSAWG